MSESSSVQYRQQLQRQRVQVAHILALDSDPMSAKAVANAKPNTVLLVKQNVDVRHYLFVKNITHVILELIVNDDLVGQVQRRAESLLELPQYRVFAEQLVQLQLYVDRPLVIYFATEQAQQRAICALRRQGIERVLPEVYFADTGRRIEFLRALTDCSRAPANTRVDPLTEFIAERAPDQFAWLRQQRARFDLADEQTKQLLMQIPFFCGKLFYSEWLAKLTAITRKLEANDPVSLLLRPRELGWIRKQILAARTPGAPFLEQQRFHVLQLRRLAELERASSAAGSDFTGTSATDSVIEDNSDAELELPAPPAQKRAMSQAPAGFQISKLCTVNEELELASSASDDTRQAAAEAALAKHREFYDLFTPQQCMQLWRGHDFIWNSYIDAYARKHRASYQAALCMLQSVRVSRNAKVLIDLAAANGFVAQQLAQEKKSAFAVSQYESISHSRAIQQLNDTLRTELEDGAADFALVCVPASGAYERLVNEAARVLAEPGVLIVACQTAAQLQLVRDHCAKGERFQERQSDEVQFVAKFIC